MKFGKHKKLNKEIGLFGVYAIATGTTISGGLFLLPGLAASNVGPTVLLVYLLATIPLIPAMFSVLELATAMPRAGGVYYFLDRTLGPMWGTVGGIGTWLALILKVSFALVGMGAYISIFFPQFPIKPISITIAVLIGIVNYAGAKKSSGLQTILLGVILFIMVSFDLLGIFHINPEHFRGFWEAGLDDIYATTGMVYISYVGITKIASLSEEVKNPERNLPLGVFLAFLTSVVIYGATIAIMIGVIPMAEFTKTLTPVAHAADILFGKAGLILTSLAALFAFISVANAGTLSASRYPLAMSRDHLVPPVFKKLSKKNIPLYALIITVALILTVLIFLDPMGIAKLASAFQLIMFALVCLAVIVMRESKIEAYDPGYRSPFYPYMQLIGIVVPFFLIFKMGTLPLVFSTGLLLLGILWYFYYGRKRVDRNGAIFHVFERLGRQRYQGLEIELRGIMKEKGLRKEDNFDAIVERSKVIDYDKTKTFEEVVEEISHYLARIVPHSFEELQKQFLEGTRIGATPVTHGIAIPHIRIQGMLQPEMILVRGKKGIKINFVNPITDKEENETVHAIFFLVSPEQNPTQHLRLLAQIAGRVEEESFYDDWMAAQSEAEIRLALLHDERWITLKLSSKNATAEMINKAIKEVKLPENALIAVIRRAGRSIIPKGNVVLKEGDILTIIGDPAAMRELEEKYSEISYLKKR